MKPIFGSLKGATQSLHDRLDRADHIGALVDPESSKDVWTRAVLIHAGATRAAVSTLRLYADLFPPSTESWLASVFDGTSADLDWGRPLVPEQPAASAPVLLSTSQVFGALWAVSGSHKGAVFMVKATTRRSTPVPGAPTGTCRALALGAPIYRSLGEEFARREQEGTLDPNEAATGANAVFQTYIAAVETIGAVVGT